MKKLSLILAIAMMATIFCFVMPTTAAADDVEVVINGVPEVGTLEDAIMMGALDEATEDVTIVLQKDVSVSNMQFTSKFNNADGSAIGYTIDLNGFTMTVTGYNGLMLGGSSNEAGNLKDNRLTVKNGYIISDQAGCAFQCYSYGSLDLENVVITVPTELNYCVINTLFSGNIDMTRHLDVTMKNVIINMYSSKDASFLRTGNGDGPSTITAENCQFNAIQGPNGEAPKVSGIHTSSSTSTVSLKNCTFNVTNSVDTATKCQNVTFADCVVNVNGNTATLPANIKATDDPLVNDGFVEFDLPKAPETTPAPETSAVPETTPAPETSAVPETTPAPETTEAPTTDAPTTNAPTEAPNTTAKPDTTTAPSANENKGGGCGGFTVAASFLAIVCAAGAAIVIKKK